MPGLTPCDFPPRGGMLPAGCKDLLDVIKRGEAEKAEAEAKAKFEAATKKKHTSEYEAALANELNITPSTTLQVIEIDIEDEITVQELANQMFFPLNSLIIVLISMKVVVANGDKVIPFEVAVEVGKRLGFEVRKAE